MKFYALLKVANGLFVDISWISAIYTEFTKPIPDQVAANLQIIQVECLIICYKVQ